MNIKLNIEELRTSSNNLKNFSQEIGNTIQGIDKVINALPENWEGQTALSFQEQYVTYRNNLVNTQNFVNDIAVQIDQVLANSQDLAKIWLIKLNRSSNVKSTNK